MILIIIRQFAGNKLQNCDYPINFSCVDSYRMGQVMITKFQKPWLENQRIFSLSALGKEHDQLLKTLHGFTEDVSQGSKV
jgi:hypothetical protein